MTRWDWGQDLFEWFEYYLQNRGPKPDLNVQVQRHDGLWRIEDTYPAQNSEKIVLEEFGAECKSLVGICGLLYSIALSMKLLLLI